MRGFKDAARPMTHSSSRKQLSNLATGWMSLPGHWSPALNTISYDEWCRTWPAHFNCHPLDGNVMLTRTLYIDACIESRPRTAPVVARPHTGGTAAERLRSTLSQLAEMPSQFCITTLNLSGCAITCQDALILAGVLAQCPALSHLNLERNYIRGVGAGWLAPVLVQCTLSWLSLGRNEIGDEGASRLAGVVRQCLSLSFLNVGKNKVGAEGVGKLVEVCGDITQLDLSENEIGDEGAGRLAEALGQCPTLCLLNLQFNGIGAVGADSLARFLTQKCPALFHLNLECNDLRDDGAAKIALVLAQCPALSHLNLAGNGIGQQGGESLAEVLGHCPLLSHLNLKGNWIPDAVHEKLRASWCDLQVTFVYNKGDERQAVGLLLQD